MTILAPQLQCLITAPNCQSIDYSANLVYNGGRGGISITQNFGRQGDTATLNVIDAQYSSGAPPHLVVKPSFKIPAYSTITLRDIAAYYYLIGHGYSIQDALDAATIFAGYVQHPTLYINSPLEAEWSLSCVDYSGYANASIVQGLYEGIPMGDAVVDLVNKANCGISAALISNGGYVEPGPLLPRTIIHYTNLTNGLQRISRMASSQSAYGWYVDESLNLHFYDQQQATSSGVTVTDAPTSSGLLSYTECHIDQAQGLQYEFDGTSLYNRALVVGASKVIATNTQSPATDSWTSDGKTTQWYLSHVPNTTVRLTSTTASTRLELPVVTVNGTNQNVTVFDGVTPVTTPYTITQTDAGRWILKVTPGYGTVPSPGSTVSIWYRYKTTITAQADLKRSQHAVNGPNKGIFAKVISQTSIDTTAAAYQRATRELAEYGHPQERIVFTTTPEFIGVWRAGQTFVLKSQFLLDSQRNFEPGLHAKFMISQQTCTVGDNGFRTWQVTAIRVG